MTLQSITFAFDSSTKNIIENLDLTLNAEWTGLIGPNGCGKSTLLKIIAKQLSPVSGSILHRLDHMVLCAQEIWAPPDNFGDFLEAYDNEALKIKTALSLHSLCGAGWQQMSCGEQKRFQLACALWQQPELLLVDEPTNHLDEINRRYIVDALRRYTGVGVIVSHDRQVLEALCAKCVFFVDGNIYQFASSYQTAQRDLDDTFSSATKQKELATRQARQLKKEADRLERLTAGSKKRLSKGQVARKDHDSKAKIDRARLTGKDASLAKKKAQLELRVDKLGDVMRQHQTPKDYSGAIGFDTPPPRSRVLLDRKAGMIPLPSGVSMVIPDLDIRGGDKVAVMGLNGVGKSTLLKMIVENGWLKTQSMFYLPQELDNRDIADLQNRLGQLSKDDFSRCLQIIARLGSDAKQVLKMDAWSAGEARKVAVALSIVTGIELLIMDEPTNHLDLPAIERLEQALSSSHLSLIVVSHDRPFLQAVCTRWWNISRREDGLSELREVGNGQSR